MIRIDAQSNATTAASTTVSVSHTVAPGAALLVGVVAVAGSQGWGTGNHITAMTYNGVAMTKLTQFDGDNTSGTHTVGIYYLANPDPGTHSISFTHSGNHNGGIHYNGAVIGLSFYGASGVGDVDNNGGQVTLTTIKPNSLIFNVGLAIPTSAAHSITGTNFVDALLAGQTNWYYEGGYSTIINPGNSVRAVTADGGASSHIAAVEITAIPWGGFFLRMV